MNTDSTDTDKVTSSTDEPDAAAQTTSANEPEVTDAAPDPDVPEVGTSDKRSFWRRRGGRATAITVGLVLALLVAGVFWATAPNKLEPYDPPLDQAVLEQNSIVYTALVDLGLQTPYVRLSTEEAYVAYDAASSPANLTWLAGSVNTTESEVVQSGMAITPAKMQRMVLGAVGQSLRPVTEWIVIDQHNGTEDRTVWKVALADTHAFFLGELDVDEFEQRIEISTAPAVNQE